jgi:hypothetical protein
MGFQSCEAHSQGCSRVRGVRGFMVPDTPADAPGCYQWGWRGAGAE